MTKEQRFSPSLDLVAGLVTGFLLLAIMVVIMTGNQLGVRVVAQSSGASLLGPFDALTLVFSEPVDESLAMQRFSIQPNIRGNFEWIDSTTMRFIPSQPFQSDTEYTLALSPGLLTSKGKSIKKSQSWTFQTRSPKIVYLVTDKDMSRLWSVDMNGGTPTPLTDESLLIFNYDAAKNGDFVVVSAFNEKNGLDLWRVEREGGNATLLLQCGADRCSVPAISPDGKFIAYVRETAAPTADLSFGSPRIWILNLETREDAPLYEDQQIIGYGPEWSPDGTRLASYDGIKDELRLLDFITNEQLIIPTQIGTPITWSPDGESIVYTDMAVNEFGIHTRIHQATITVNEISTLVGDTDEWDYAYTSLAWSPVENKLVIGLRPYADDPSMALLLMDPVFLDGEAIASEPDRIYLNPSWDLWGRALLFQQFQLFGIHKPEIVFWMPGFDQPQALAEGIMPQWLP